METILEILKYTIPALIVFFTAYYTLKSYLDHRLKLQQQEINKDNKKVTIPLILQAHERLILFLERIHPNNLVHRLYRKGMQVHQMQALMSQTVREEFEHNLAQQLYLTDTAWELVKTAREDVLRIINESANQLPADANGNDLSQNIIEHSVNIQSIPKAITKLKSDVTNLLK